MTPDTVAATAKLRGIGESMRGSTSVEPVRDYIERELLDGQVELGSDTPLVESGVLDSASLLSLAGFIEEHYDVDLTSDDVNVTNFASLAAIGGLLARTHGATDA